MLKRDCQSLLDFRSEKTSSKNCGKCVKILNKNIINMRSFCVVLCTLALCLTSLEVEAQIFECPVLTEVQKLLCWDKTCSDPPTCPPPEEKNLCTEAGYYYCAEKNSCFTKIFHPRTYDEAVQKCSSLNTPGLTFQILDHVSQDSSIIPCYNKAISAYSVRENEQLWGSKTTDCLLVSFVLDSNNQDEIVSANHIYELPEDFSCNDPYPFYCHAFL